MDLRVIYGPVSTHFTYSAAHRQLQINIRRRAAFISRWSWRDCQWWGWPEHRVACAVLVPVLIVKVALKVLPFLVAVGSPVHIVPGCAGGPCLPPLLQ